MHRDIEAGVSDDTPAADDFCANCGGDEESCACETVAEYIVGVTVTIIGLLLFQGARKKLLPPHIEIRKVLERTGMHIHTGKRTTALRASGGGVSAVVFLAPATVTVLSIQWGNVVAPMVVIAQARGGEPVSEELLALAR